MNGNQKSICQSFNKKCELCGFRMFKLSVYPNCGSICELCEIVVNFNPYFFTKGIICISNLSQLEIINRTHIFFKNKRQIPQITEIDPDVEIVPIPYPEIISFFTNAPDNVFDKNEILSKFKIFFTNQINPNNYISNDFIKKTNFNNDFKYFKQINVPKANIDKCLIDLVKSYSQ
jgi:hypothetical protein